jgi:DNA-binding winged helix-turn-helix (wHTH) protein/tetratricopeptide (TPR) repeat protein
MSATLYRFTNCEVDTGARELRVAGRPQALEPLPFDLLVLLLRERQRHIPTEELLDRLWQGEPVSPGSVANAVAKVRRAIGDLGDPPLIRTFHRLGYRFVGTVVEGLAASPAHAKTRAAHPPLQLALLPFENLTGDPALDWLALGLMSLVRHALAEDERLSPLPVPVVLTAMQRGRPEASERVRAVQQLTGVRHVVQTRVLQSSAAYRLDYRLSSPEYEASGSIEAEDPVTLGRQLARRLLVHFSPDSPLPQIEEGALDPWALEVLARAMEAVAARQWRRAEQLLAVVVDLAPRHEAAHLELLQARAMVHEGQARFDAALECWRRAAQRAHAARQGAVAVRTSGRAALAAAMCGHREEALRRVEEGLAHAQANGDPDQICRRIAQLCQVHTMVGEPVPLSRLPLSHAGVPAVLAEDARGAWWAVRGHGLSARSDMAGAARCFGTAVALYRSAGAAGREAALLMWWVDALLKCRRLIEAESVMRRAEACSGDHGFLQRGLPWLRARLRNARGDRRGALAALACLLDGPARDLGHAAACALSARWSLQAGESAEAHRLLGQLSPAFLHHPMVVAAAKAGQAAVDG